MNAKNWRACAKDGVTKSKPVYAAQITLYQAYMEGTVPGIAAAPALFYAAKVLPYADSHPHLAAYLERLKARPSYARVLRDAEPYFHMFPQGDQAEGA